MQFLLLLFLAPACLQDEWSAPWDWFATPICSALLTWIGVAGVAILAQVMARIVCRRLREKSSEREELLRRYGKWRVYHVLILLGVFALALYGFGWGWAVQQMTGSGVSEIPGTELLVLLPFVVGLVLSWTSFYDVERALHRTGVRNLDDFWGRRAYVGFHIRQNLALVFVPILMLIVMKGLRRLWPEADEELTWATSLAGMIPAVTIVIVMPWVLRLVLALKPLPDGFLRDRLQTTAKRLHFRCSNILLWNTHNGVANAMVVGILPWLRYVLLTDRLLAEMSPEEVEAVYGHEIGHIKHHHMTCYLGFLLPSLLLLWWVWTLAVRDILPFQQLDHSLQALPPIALLGVYIFLVFGFLSRRCERQADLYGCRAVSCGDPDCEGHDTGVVLAPAGRGLCATGIRTFIEALEKVAQVNGISRDRPGWLQSWQHSTIARRVDFLQRVLADPSLERHFQRRVSLVKWGLFLALGAALTVLFYHERPSSSSSSLENPPAERREGRIVSGLIRLSNDSD
jgi:Zn-dependent protease with chaperone function